MDKNIRLIKFVLIIISILFSTTQIPQAFAQVQRQANIVEIKGKVEVLKANQNNWTSARKGQVLVQSDSIRTDAKAQAVLAIEGVGNPSMVKIESGSELKLSDLALDQKTGAENTLLDMAIGNILINTEPRPGSQFQVKTPTSIVGARGTSFRVKEY